MLWLFLAGLFTFVIIGIPIVFSLGITNLIMLQAMDMPFIVVAHKIFAGINSFPLLAIPFFMFVGQVMDKGGIAKRLIDLANALIGHIIGGLGHVNILASMFFGGISGSALADSAAIGSLIIPPMKRQNFPASYSAAVTASSAVIGIIIPPSIPFILYGIITNTSILSLFLAGIVPGLIIGFSLMVTTFITCKKHGYGVNLQAPKEKFQLKTVWQSFKRAWLALLIPVIVVGGMLGGVFTATEAGAISALVAIIQSVFIYKEIKLQDLPAILYSTAKVSSVVLFLVGIATTTAWLLTRARVPFALVEMLEQLALSPIWVLILANVLLFLVGCVMDFTPAMLILAPVLLPVMVKIGIDPTYFGVIMSINLGIGLITPPIGTVLYVVCGIADIRLEQLVKAIIPFLCTLILVLILIICFPDLVMFIPNLVF